MSLFKKKEPIVKYIDKDLDDLLEEWLGKVVYWMPFYDEGKVKKDTVTGISITRVEGKSDRVWLCGETGFTMCTIADAMSEEEMIEKLKSL